MVTRTQAIKTFLEANTHADLAGLYHHDMECQVNVAQDDGNRIEGEYKGKQWHGWTDGIQTWKSFRIPYGANSEPNYDDREMTFSLTDHAEGIGMTGWDWRNRLSRWVAFDFDAITGHSDKNTNKHSYEELQLIKESASEIPWVTVRLSTSGKGLHLYVMLQPVNTVTHTEHAALSRAILALMSAYAGFDFKSKVDVQGGNMWVWHRKMKGTDGLKIVKVGETLVDIPQNWRDHVAVVSGKRHKVRPSFVSDREIDKFTELTGQQTFIKLDDEHKKLIKFLSDSNSAFWWDGDHHMLVAHTWDLLQGHNTLNFRGVFNTISTGKDHGHDHNCFLTPLRKGSWIVRRYGKEIKEHPTWSQDKAGWTYCYFNRNADLATAARAHGGIEDEGNKFVFRNGNDATQAALILGSDLDIPVAYMGRRTILKMHKDEQRIVVEIDKEDMDLADHFKNWLPVKGKWRKIVDASNVATFEPNVGDYDDIIRHLVNVADKDCGWVIKSNNTWNEEPLVHVRPALDSMGIKTNESRAVIGDSVLKPWKLISLPFQPEYPGDRQWNRNAPQFKFIPNLTKDNLTYPHWMMILDHIGDGINDVVLQDPWCQVNGLKSGADYLKCWIASLIQYPTKHLPYLFLFGPQNSGKSILHEALTLLFTSGTIRAEAALTSQNGFNAELEKMILCIIEEIDLNKNKQAYNRIKDWVTSLTILIHEKRFTPYQIVNTTHWIQCSNDRNSFPIFSGDSRVTFLNVPAISGEIIPKSELLILLEKEAPDFLAEMLRLELPPSNDRLNVPVLETQEKQSAAAANMSALEIFLLEQCYHIPGSLIPVGEFYETFMKWLDPQERYNWTKIKMGKEMPSIFPKGRSTKDAQFNFGNISFRKDTEPSAKLILNNGYLKPDKFSKEETCQVQTLMEVQS